MKVVVTGAGGRTGGLVVQKLLEQPDRFDPIATVRNQQSGQKLVAAGLPESNLKTLDLASLPSTSELSAMMSGAQAVVIATSGVPQIKYLSLIPVMLAKLFKKEGVRPQFTWKAGQMPEQVDWLGQKAQIDAAKAAGVEQVVLISSMGGTDPNHMLNKLGDGNILQWKRKAEQYLIASGLKYTIIHPGGLIDEPAGARELVVDVDDRLLENTARSIPRGDVAALAVGCLGLREATNRSFDVISKPPGEGEVTKDWGPLLAGLSDKTCDYSINSQWSEAELVTARS